MYARVLTEKDQQVRQGHIILEMSLSFFLASPECSWLSMLPVVTFQMGWTLTPQCTSVSYTLGSAEGELEQFALHLMVELPYVPPTTRAISTHQTLLQFKDIEGVTQDKVISVKWTLCVPVLKRPLDTFLLRPHSLALYSVPFFVFFFFHLQIPNHSSSKTVVGFLFSSPYMLCFFLPNTKQRKKDKSIFTSQSITPSSPDYKKIEDRTGSLENPKALQKLGLVFMTQGFSNQASRPSRKLPSQFSSSFLCFTLE